MGIWNTRGSWKEVVIDIIKLHCVNVWKFQRIKNKFFLLLLVFFFLVTNKTNKTQTTTSSRLDCQEGPTVDPGLVGVIFQGQHISTAWVSCVTPVPTAVFLPWTCWFCCCQALYSENKFSQWKTIGSPFCLLRWKASSLYLDLRLLWFASWNCDWHMPFTVEKIVSDSFKILPKAFSKKECRQPVLCHSKPDMFLK